LDTVAVATPARAATSRMVAAGARRSPIALLPTIARITVRVVFALRGLLAIGTAAQARRTHARKTIHFSTGARVHAYFLGAPTGMLRN
jgi:hypothetical protein